MREDRPNPSAPPPGVHVPERNGASQGGLTEFSSDTAEQKNVAKVVRETFSLSFCKAFLSSLKRKAPRRGHFLKDAVDLVASLFRVAFLIFGPVLSAVSIWISVAGIALTLLSGVEPFIQLAHWVRYLIIVWRNFTHRLWDVIAPYIGIQIPLELKDFGTFIVLLVMALCLAFFSRGRRLVVYDAVVGMRMAIFGISHAIGTSARDGSAQQEMTRLQLLFFEIDQFLGRQLRAFFLYSIPFVTAFNLIFRVSIIFVPMIILVPEDAFSQYFKIDATRVEYLFLSIVLSYCAALIVVLCGAIHIVFHFCRATVLFLMSSFSLLKAKSVEGVIPIMKSAVRDARFGITYSSLDPIRREWSERFFLVRLSATMIRSNWIFFPISSNEKFHRKYDPFLWLSERRYADPAFLDRIAKGLLLFFILYALNWVSVNGDNITNMFSPPGVDK